MMVHRNDVVRATDLMREQNGLRLLKRDSTVRYAFCVPHSMDYLVDRYCEAMLGDATHRLKCGGYIL